LRQQKQEVEMRVMEVQNKYRAAKKKSRRYKVWADGTERHCEQKWQNSVVCVEDILQTLQATIQEAFAESAVIKELDEKIQALRDTLL